jgi:hypothetical protein
MKKELIQYIASQLLSQAITAEDQRNLNNHISSVIQLISNVIEDPELSDELTRIDSEYVRQIGFVELSDLGSFPKVLNRYNLNINNIINNYKVFLAVPDSHFSISEKETFSLRL